MKTAWIIMPMGKGYWGEQLVEDPSQFDETYWVCFLRTDPTGTALAVKKEHMTEEDLREYVNDKHLVVV